MGVYDSVRSRKPLPDKPDCIAPDHWFQTKSLPFPGLEHYEITEDGRLVRITDDGEASEPVASDFHGTMNLHTIGDRDTPNRRWIEYEVRFDRGKLLDMRLLENYALDDKVEQIREQARFEASNLGE